MSLSAFLLENTIKIENVKFVASKRFLSDETDPETGKRKPMEWEIRPITATEDEEIRKSCTRRVPVPGKKNQFQRETDTEAYLGKLAAACTVEPNLYSAELLADRHCNRPDELLKAMLTPGEYTEYLIKVQEVCGFDITLQDEIEEAKN